MRLTKYDLDKEVRKLRRQIHEIEELKDTVNSPGWKQVVDVFAYWIEKLTSDWMELCDNPKGNHVEIKTKKMVSEAIANILSALDVRTTESDAINMEIKRIDKELKKGKYNAI